MEDPEDANFDSFFADAPYLHSNCIDPDCPPPLFALRNPTNTLIMMMNLPHNLLDPVVTVASMMISLSQNPVVTVASMTGLPQNPVVIVAQTMDLLQDQAEIDGSMTMMCLPQDPVVIVALTKKMNLPP